MQPEEISIRIREYLKTCASKHDLHHAYLFIGQKGEGDNICRDVCKKISGKDPVILNEGINAVRDLVKELSLASNDGGYRCFLIPDAGALNQESANALLKILEEPPMKTIFFFLAATRQSVIPTIVSRCHLIRIPLARAPKKSAKTDYWTQLLYSQRVTQFSHEALSNEDYSDFESAIRTVVFESRENPDILAQCVRFSNGYTAMRQALHHGMKDRKASDLFFLTVDMHKVV